MPKVGLWCRPLETIRAIPEIDKAWGLPICEARSTSRGLSILAEQKHDRRDNDMIAGFLFRGPAKCV
jgi:hypothetical protein